MSKYFNFQTIKIFFQQYFSRKKKPATKETFLGQMRVFFSTYFLALLLRTFLVEASQIPSQSMVPSLMVGDILMVEKVSLGGYIPVLNKKLLSFSKPKVNDMVVFVSPEWQAPSFFDQLITFLSLSLINKDNTFQNPKILVKRIVAGPGETIFMENGELHHNGINLSQGQVASQNQLFYIGGRKKGSMRYYLFEEKGEGIARVVQHMYEMTSIKEDTLAPYEQDNFIYTLRTLLIHGFPEIMVPKKGVNIDIGNVHQYQRYLLAFLIQQESGIKTQFLKGKIYQGNKEISSWTPNDDYYFMMGDNRDYSEDSRYFGYVAKDKIYGRVLFRYWPFNRLGFNINASSKYFIKN